MDSVSNINDFVIRILLGEEYKFWSSLMCSFNNLLWFHSTKCPVFNGSNRYPNLISSWFPPWVKYLDISCEVLNHKTGVCIYGKAELTNSMELSTTWEATGCAATREPPSILWKPNAHYRIDERPLLVRIVSQTNPRSILVLWTHLRLDLPSGLLPSGFPTSNLYAFLVSIHATYPTNLILLDLIILIILSEEYKSRRSSLCSFLEGELGLTALCFTSS
jgi:hypothetical protein